MVTDRLTDRLGLEPTLSVKRSITIDTMIQFDRDIDGHGDGDGTCKQALTQFTEWEHVWSSRSLDVNGSLQANHYERISRKYIGNYKVQQDLGFAVSVRRLAV